VSRRQLRRLALALFCVPAIAAADHLVVTTPSYTGPGVASRFVAVERRTDAGLPQTQGDLGMLVVTDSPTGEFTFTPWQFSRAYYADGGLLIGIPNGSTTAYFSYRDRAVKTHQLTVTSGSIATVVAPFTVGPVILDDDFEGNMSMLDVPQGVWPWRQLSPGNSLDFDRILAHRGDGGLHGTDLDNGSLDGGGGGYLGFFFDRFTSTVYFRGWLLRRTRTPGRTGGFTLLGGPGVIYMIELGSAGEVSFGGATNDGFIWSPNVANIPNNQWALISGKLSGLGTDAGERQLFVGGTDVASQKNQGLLGYSLDTVFLGHPPLDQAFTGEQFWDDVRISTEPTADTLAFAVPSTVPTMACTAVALRLVNTIDQALAPAPYELEVAVHFKGPGQLHLTSDCRDAPVTTVRLPKGQSKVSAYITGAGATGASSVRAEHLDFLTDEADLTFLPGFTLDGGRLPDGGFEPMVQRDLKVGCACSTSSPLFGSAVVLLALASRRRPSRRAGKNAPLLG
jgi:hypothetical protein